MDELNRTYTKLSLCGLNCGLCTMYHMKAESRCPGCGGPGHQSCAIKKCAIHHGSVEYCFECAEYPCEKYEGIADYDSFISHKNMLSNFERVKLNGLEAYQIELDQKVEILTDLLEGYNDGRRKSFFSQAVNLLELVDVESVMETIKEQANSSNTLKERAIIAVGLFQKTADERGISLKLNREKKK